MTVVWDTHYIEGLTEYVVNCIQSILKEANSSLNDVVKMQIFLTNINDFRKYHLLEINTLLIVNQ